MDEYGGRLWAAARKSVPAKFEVEIFQRFRRR